MISNFIELLSDLSPGFYFVIALVWVIIGGWFNIEQWRFLDRGLQENYWNPITLFKRIYTNSIEGLPRLRLIPRLAVSIIIWIWVYIWWWLGMILSLRFMKPLILKEN